MGGTKGVAPSCSSPPHECSAARNGTVRAEAGVTLAGDAAEEDENCMRLRVELRRGGSWGEEADREE